MKTLSFDKVTFELKYEPLVNFLNVSANSVIPICVHWWNNVAWPFFSACFPHSLEYFRENFSFRDNLFIRSKLLGNKRPRIVSAYSSEIFWPIFGFSLNEGSRIYDLKFSKCNRTPIVYILNVNFQNFDSSAKWYFRENFLSKKFKWMCLSVLQWWMIVQYLENFGV